MSVEILTATEVEAEFPFLEGGTHEEVAASIIHDCDGDAPAAVVTLVKIIHLLMLDKEAVMRAVSPDYV